MRADMSAFLAGVDRSDTKNTIKAVFLTNAEQLHLELSRSRAALLADKYKRGRLDQYDLDLVSVLGYQDWTGEQAVENVLARAA